MKIAGLDASAKAALTANAKCICTTEAAATAAAVPALVEQKHS
jgi:hypothetical protein